MAGTYSVTATVNGCPSPAATTSVVVNATPATPTAGSNSPVCTGGTITLTTPTVAGATYAWTGPNGFTSTAQNPTIPSATTAMAGTYSVTVTGSGCVSGAGTVNVVVNDVPATPTAGNGGAVCSGGTISLTASTVAGATYAWTGPNGFTSTAQNPTISNATTAMAGTYSVTATVNGCASPAGTTAVVVNATPPAPTAGNGGAVCAGGTISLTASTVAGATYAWTGPNGFTSAVQNPTISNATTAMGGTYSVTATVNGCTSPAGTTAVVVASPPATPTPTNDGPKCAGETVQLSVGFVSGATYAWTGPNGFTSTEMLPSLSAVTSAMAGVYSVRVSVGGCTSAAGTTTVVVSSTPAQPVVTAPERVSPGQSFTASVPSVAGVTYSWAVTNGTVTAGAGTRQITVRAGETSPVTVSVTETNTTTGCVSPEGRATVLVGLAPTGFYPVTPCRLFDTRETTGAAAAGPVLAPGETRTFTVGSRCCIPSSRVRSLSVNLAAIEQAAAGQLVLYRGDLAAAPGASSLTYSARRTRANNGLLELSRSGDGTFKVYNSSQGEAHFILDVNGVFAESLSEPITAPESVCADSAGNSASVADAGAGATYAWTITNGTITAGAGTRSVTWRAGATGPVRLSVTVRTSAGCTSSGTADVALDPSPTISSFTATPSTISFFGTSTLNFTIANATSWSLSSSLGHSAGPASGSGSGAFTAVYSADNATGTDTVTLTVTGPCGTTTQTVQIVVCSPADTPNATITAPSSVCHDSTDNAASVPSAGAGATYAWTITNGTITGGNGTNAITFSAGPTGPVQLSVTVTNASGCPAPGSASVTVTPALGISSLTATPSTIPGGTASTLSFTISDASSWTLSGTLGNSITPSTGTGSGTFTSNYSAANNTGTDTVTLTVTGPCGTKTQTVQIIVN